jgi:hypothetical protein
MVQNFLRLLAAVNGDLLSIADNAVHLGLNHFDLRLLVS